MLGGRVARLVALAPALVGGTVTRPAGRAAAAVSAASRAGSEVLGAALAPPSAVLRRAVATHGAPARRVWSADGRAQVEVRGTDGPDGAALAARVEEALGLLEGVRWARVDGPTRRAVVRFDPAVVTVQRVAEVVALAEEDDGDAAAGTPRPRRHDPVHDPVHDDFPGDPAALATERWALAADLAGLAAAVAGQLVRLPALPGSVAAAAVLLDSQPRLRGLLERGVGVPAADLVVATANAVSLGLTQGTSSLVVDAAQRAGAVAAARARREAFDTREEEWWDADRPAGPVGGPPAQRPVPLPAGPVERYADRASVASLLAAGGLLAATRDADLAGRAVLVGAPKAARAARESFADTLTRELSARGVLVVDPAALRRLDRVDAVVVDSAVLHDDRPLVVSARALAGHWSDEHVWSAAQRLLGERDGLPVPPPPGRRRERLAMEPVPGAGGRAARWTLTEDGVGVGEVVVGTELDPHADAVLAGVQAAGLRLAVTADPAAAELAGRADEVLDAAVPLAEHVRRLQAAGRVVAVVAADERALAAADLGIGLVPARGRVPWAADVLLGPGLADVPLVVGAAPGARAVSRRGVTLTASGAFLGALLAAVGGPGRRGRATLPVTTAAAAALLDGTLAARRAGRRPPPVPVLHTPWHGLEPDDVLARLPRPGPRTGPAAVEAAPPGWTARLARTVAAELADPLTPVLGTGAAASAVIGSPTDALLVGGVVVGNALVSGVQRLRAERSLRDLLAGQQLRARVVGEDGTVRVPAARLVPGQVVDLQPGDVVPADGRLLRVDGLEVDESSLTGESGPVGKQVAATPAAELADRACMVYEGTTVLAGTGRAVVVATGAATEAGRAVALAAGASGPAGMQARLEELTRRGLPVTLLGGAAVTGLALLRGRPPRQAIASGVGIAVAAVPEGLPLVATVAQTGAARRLSGRGVLVRSARTVEALGRVDTVCFDKTGTLTEGRLRLVRLAGLTEQWPPGAPEAARVLRSAARACPRPDDGQPAAHATDRAILEAADAVLGDAVAANWEELTEVPFQSDRGYSAALGRTAGDLRLVVKGAPEVLLPRCTHLREDGGERRFDRRDRERATRMVHDLAAEGLRVLAVARRTVGRAEPAGEPDPEELTEDLTLLGFVALADVPRPQAAGTVAALRDAGLTPVMITGDHPVTARSIARGLGIAADRVVTGPEFAALDEAGRAQLVTCACVYARVSPEQKLRIVAALQRAGRVVAMTGDGANDAAAIRLADVGIGMAAHGSTSARTAADLVLTRPDPSLLLDALVEGRAMWGRVRDAVSVLLGGNAGEVGFTLAGTALAGRAPLGTRQFLLVNMLTDLLPSMAIALAPTPQAADARRRLLAGGAPSLGAPLLRDIAVRGAATGVGALAAWQIGRVTGLRRRASTMALVALVGTQLGQTLVVGGRDPLVVATALGSAAALAGIVQTPGVSHFFGCAPLGPLAWSVVLGSAAGTTALSVLAGRLLAAPAPPDPDRTEEAP